MRIKQTNMEGPLILLAVLFVVGGPIAAIVALVRVYSLESSLPKDRSQDLISRLYTLEQRLDALEQKKPSAVSPIAESARVKVEPTDLAAQPVVPPQPTPFHPAPPPAPVPPAAPSQSASAHPALPPSLTAVSPLHTSLADDGHSLDLETRIAGRWFNRIGIVAILFAISYFLKLAFDNNWIGPSGRVAIGIVIGAVLLPWSQWLLKRGYTYFSEGIAGLGEATLYLSVWAGCQYYSLFSRNVGFIAMIVITALMAGVALGRNSQRIALLSLIGGFLTPLLVSSSKNEEVVLFTYLLILGAGFLVIGSRRKWVSLAPLSLIFTLVYFWGWYSDFYNQVSLERTVLYATLFFLLYATFPALRAIDSQFDEWDIAMHLINSFAYVAALYTMLWPQDRWPLTLFTLALAAVHLVVARVVPPEAESKSQRARFLFAGLALTFATLAIPFRLDGKWITVALAIEGAALVWSGFQSATAFMRQAGYLLLVIAAFRVLFFPPPAGAFLLNQRFAAYLVLILSLGVALWAARGRTDTLGQNERAETGILAVAINVFALTALSLEVWDYYGKASLTLNASFAQHLALSALWTIYACALILIGVQRHSALLRWQSLALFGVTVAKVFLYDLSSLQRAYRVLSFLILGVVLLIVSFLYTRRIARERSSS